LSKPRARRPGILAAIRGLILALAAPVHDEQADAKPGRQEHDAEAAHQKQLSCRDGLRDRSRGGLMIRIRSAIGDRARKGFLLRHGESLAWEETGGAVRRRSDVGSGK